MNLDCLSGSVGYLFCSSKDFQFELPPPPLLCHLMFSKGRNTLGHVTLQHVALTNRFMYTGEFLSKSLSSQHNFVIFTSHTKSFWICVAHLKDRDFPNNSPEYTMWFLLGQLVSTYCCNLSPKLYTRNGLLPQCVAATCCPVCSDLYITAIGINLLSQFLAVVTVNL